MESLTTPYASTALPTTTPTTEVAYYEVFAILGAIFAMTLSSFGAACGTWNTSIGFISEKSRSNCYYIVGNIIAGVLAIYGLIISVIISSQLSHTRSDLAKSLELMGAGFVVGIAGLASGIALGKIGNAWTRLEDPTSKQTWMVILSMIFAEAIGLYGLIIALIMVSASD